MQTKAPGVSISQVARRYVMSSNQIFNWLKDTRFSPPAADEAGEDAVFTFRSSPTFGYNSHQLWLDHDFDQCWHQNLNDGRGSYLGNIFVERLWRSLNQEGVYLYVITDGFQAKRFIDNLIGFHNSKWPHTALDKHAPIIAYCIEQQTRKVA